MTDDRRAVLEAIAFGDDARVTPADRLRALEQLEAVAECPRCAQMENTSEAEVRTFFDQAVADAVAAVLRGEDQPYVRLADFPAARSVVEFEFASAVEKRARELAADLVERGRQLDERKSAVPSSKPHA